MNTITIQYFKSAFGELILGSFENQLCLADWRYRSMRNSIDNRIQSGLGADYVEGESETIENAKTQLLEYFKAGRTTFEIPLLMVGTDFQKQVWDELLKIPYGSTNTYLHLSKNLGNEKAIRAVAAANGANAISIIIPCHRVVGSNGELVGYAGGLATKQKLLKLEGIGKDKGQLDLFD